ncbi:MAG: tRNA pseudouridine(55) synthase TruB [Ignavibacteriae bacterium]|nr:tRNA pseudouridine(55) synthase TruB [Ignavibacteriota bacterium]MCB9214528.1 tRNA pseudouridine(55) synthase TruB [Ignavibacteria bacterium]
MKIDPRYNLPIVGRGELASLDPAAIQQTGALLLVDKPLEWTSFNVVAKVRNTLGIKKVGHAGTLDPLATGLLILCLGKATKLADQVQAEEKEYTGTMRLGATTETEDAEGEEREIHSVEHLTPENIVTAAQTFVGESLQTPPMFSARKVQGKRLYKLARKGIEVERPSKPITIYEFEISRIDLSTNPPQADFRVVCSKGTYIRSLARDLGEKLGVGGYLLGLRRTRSGEFRVEQGVKIGEIKEYSSPPLR